MIRAFCDKCDTDCPGQASTRRYEHLSHAMADGAVRIGLEIIPLFNGVPSQMGHICEACLMGLLAGVAGEPIERSHAMDRQIDEMKSDQGELARRCKELGEERAAAVRVAEQTADRLVHETQKTATLLAQIQRQSQEMETMRRDYANRLDVRRNLKESA